MALQIKTLATRSLTALFFVIALLGSLLFSYATFSIFFFLVALIGAKEFCNMAGRLGASSNKPLVMFLASLVYLSGVNWMNFGVHFTIHSDPDPAFFTLICTFLFLILALFNKNPDPLKSAAYQSVALIYAVLPMCLLHELVFSSSPTPEFEPRILLGIILLIWSNDTFAYLGGSLFGKRKLIERISPGKTIEGTLIGVLITFTLSFLLESLLAIKAGLPWYALGLIVPVLATFGDLLESLLKRQAGIKDSGTLLPGHGGVLDRFDSLILVSPVVVLLLKVL